MVEAYNSIMINDVWEVVPRLVDWGVVGSRWICKIKYAVDGDMEKSKERFVAKGYAWNEVEFKMKDLGLMHYFIGSEVWQTYGEIFLGQRRYAMEILRRFRMRDCRRMSTPIITNWREIDASEDADVDPTLYRQLIESLMYLVNIRPNIYFTVNTLS
eukprot:PITA_03671